MTRHGPLVNARISVDVAVVGAGFAGLTAATELAAHGRSVVVLEALPRVGGRTESATDDTGRTIDTGGQFVNDDMPKVLALVAAQGRTLVAGDHELASLAFRGGSEITVDPRALARLFDSAEEASQQLLTVDRSSLGTRSLADWLSGQLDGDALRSAVGGLAGAFCLSPEVLPAAHVADMDARTPFTRDELQYVVAETLHGVAVGLADALGDRVHVATRVRTIRRSASSVEVFADGLLVDATDVVVAIPPAAIASIEFDPPLSEEVMASARAFRAGSVIKFLIGYDPSFSTSRSPVGDPTADPIGSVRQWLEPAGLYTRSATTDADAPTLVAFLGGPAADRWCTWDAVRRRSALIDLLVEGYGPSAAHPLSFVERVWRPDELGGGGYCNLLVDTERLDAVDVLRRASDTEPHVVFACTELGPTFPGYVEGAITAGLAAADTVRQRAASTMPPPPSR